VIGYTDVSQLYSRDMADSNKVEGALDNDDDELQIDALSDSGMEDTEKNSSVGTFDRASRKLSSQPMYIDPQPRSYRR